MTSPLSPWDSEELDEDEIEDLESSLYGMLHHALDESSLGDSNHQSCSSLIRVQLPPPVSKKKIFSVKKSNSGKPEDVLGFDSKDSPYAENCRNVFPALQSTFVGTDLALINEILEKSQSAKEKEFIKVQSSTSAAPTKVLEDEKLKNTVCRTETGRDMTAKDSKKLNRLSQATAKGGLAAKQSTSSNSVEWKNNKSDRVAAAGKYNPFCEYIVIEDESPKKNSKSSPTISKSLSQVTEEELLRRRVTLEQKKDKFLLSKSEDSRYDAISNILPSKQCMKNGENANEDCAAVSDSDDSVIILDSSSELGDSCSSEFSSIPNGGNRGHSSTSESESEVETKKVSTSEKDMMLNIIGKNGVADIPIAADQGNWRNYISKKWTTDMINFYDTEEIIDIEKLEACIPKNLYWHLDDEDLYSRQSAKSRYYKQRDHAIDCYKCHSKHRVNEKCIYKETKCFMCGNFSNKPPFKCLPGHEHSRCPNKMCLGCGRPGAIFNECCPECRQENRIVCMICNEKHITQRCPDLWRRYHLTTCETGQLTRTAEQKPPHLLKCFNCCKLGHLWYECKSFRHAPYPAAKPWICSYQDSGEFLNQITNGGKSNINISDDRKSIWLVGDTPTSSSKVLRYSFRPTDTFDKKTLGAAKSGALSEIRNVDITWKVQKKKKRIMVEFIGDGDRIQARNNFKKILHFKTPSPKKVEAGNSTMLREKDERKKSEKSATEIEKVLVSWMSGKEHRLRRAMEVDLNLRQKRRVGVFLKKLEKKHRAQITSSVSGTSWEIYIDHKKGGQPCLSIVTSIFQFLQSIANS